jgi:hypothetical protein
MGVVCDLATHAHCYTIVNARENIPIVINRNVTYVLPFQQQAGRHRPPYELQYTERFQKSREKM